MEFGQNLPQSHGVPLLTPGFYPPPGWQRLCQGVGVHCIQVLGCNCVWSELSTVFLLPFVSKELAESVGW